MQAQGSVLTQQYAEGYPNRRYYGGCEIRRRCRVGYRPHVEALFGRARQRCGRAGRPQRRHHACAEVWGLPGVGRGLPKWRSLAAGRRTALQLDFSPTSRHRRRSRRISMVDGISPAQCRWRTHAHVVTSTSQDARRARGGIILTRPCRSRVVFHGAQGRAIRACRGHAAGWRHNLNSRSANVASRRAHPCRPVDLAGVAERGIAI